MIGTNLKREINAWAAAEFPYVVVDAPKDAISFDKMLVVYLDETKRYIRCVSLYDSKTDKIVANF